MSNEILILGLTCLLAIVAILVVIKFHKYIIQLGCLGVGIYLAITTFPILSQTISALLQPRQLSNEASFTLFCAAPVAFVVGLILILSSLSSIKDEMPKKGAALPLESPNSYPGSAGTGTGPYSGNTDEPIAVSAEEYWRQMNADAERRKEQESWAEETRKQEEKEEREQERAEAENREYWRQQDEDKQRREEQADREAERDREIRRKYYPDEE